MNQEARVLALEFYVEGRWLPGTWESLKKDTIFRCREADGKIHDQGDEHEVSIAVEDAHQEPPPAYWGVKCEPFTFVTMGHPLAHRVQVIHEDGTVLGSVQEIQVNAGIAKLGGGRMCSGVYVRLRREEPPTPKKVGEVYLHVGNSGVTFSIQDEKYGPTIEVECSTFGNMKQTTVVHTTEKGLKALAQLFSIAAERTYRKPYCYPAYPIHEYITGVDAEGHPVLVEVPRPPQEVVSSNGVVSSDEVAKTVTSAG